jgi:solute carrier family 30 (zinc transporter), member 2
MGCTLHDHGHSHGIGHSHEHSHNSSNSHDSEAAQTSQNINVRAAYIHVISDFVQSCGVFIASLVIFFQPELSIIDPICTFLFSILVLATTVNIMKDALLVSYFEIKCGTQSEWKIAVA